MRAERRVCPPSARYARVHAASQPANQSAMAKRGKQKAKSPEGGPVLHSSIREKPLSLTPCRPGRCEVARAMGARSRPPAPDGKASIICYSLGWSGPAGDPPMETFLLGFQPRHRLNAIGRAMRFSKSPILLASTYWGWLTPSTLGLPVPFAPRHARPELEYGAKPSLIQSPDMFRHWEMLGRSSCPGSAIVDPS